MSEWATFKFGDICEDISYGYTESAAWENIGPKFLRITDIQDDFINWNNVPYCPITKENHAKYKLEVGDIVIARTGASTGVAMIFKDEDIDAVYASYLIRYRIDKEKAEPFYIGYILKSFLWKSHVNSIVGGSAQPGANAKQFAAFEFPLPDLSTQSQIASILSSLDDKIELNLQMNQTLEAMAQAIFKEWFVHFNFPGFDGELVDGLPKGWRMGNVLEIATLLSGGTPKTSEPNFWDGEINWISAKDITSSNNQFIIETEKSITELGIKKSAAKLLPTFTTIISARGTVGNFCILPKEMAISQSNYGLKSKSDNDFFLFLLVKNMLSMMKAFAYGAVFDTITTKTFEAMEIIIPENQVIEEFEISIKPIYSKILTNQLQIKSLTQTRDTLLPKLMSGSLNLDSFDLSDESDSEGKSTKSFNHKNQSADK